MIGPGVRRFGVLPAVFALVALSCDGRQEPAAVAAGWSEVEGADLTGAQSSARDTALAAVGELQKSLLGEVMARMQQGGPAATIGVCKEIAPRLAAEVGRDNGVRIGRTSHRLRNPANAPPDWMRPIVDARADRTVTFAGAGDAIRLAVPIYIAAPCLVCHGEPSGFAPEVTAMFNEQYPQDAATGFAEGDLRGWFWVETNGRP